MSGPEAFDLGAGTWVTGRPRRPVPYFPRPEETREPVRTTSFARTTIAVLAAAYEMVLLDHDFFLYRDARPGSRRWCGTFPTVGRASATTASSPSASDGGGTADTVLSAQPSVSRCR